MKKKPPISQEDQALFRELARGTRTLTQDTIVHRPVRKKVSEVPPKRLMQEQIDASFADMAAAARRLHDPEAAGLFGANPTP